jgi:hypothetical protein
MKRERPTPRRLGWSQSAQFRAIGRAAIRQWNAERARLPRCEAIRKSSGGGKCRQWPMPNGRCYWHGGATPRADQYHHMQVPATVEKLDAKLHTNQRKNKRRAAWLAAMTPERRAKFDAWHRSHPSGSQAARSAERARASGNDYLRRLLASDAPEGRQSPKSPVTGGAPAAAPIWPIDDGEEGIFS